LDYKIARKERGFPVLFLEREYAGNWRLEGNRLETSTVPFNRNHGEIMAWL